MSDVYLTHLISDCDGVLVDSESVTLFSLLKQLRPYVPADSPLVALIQPRQGQNFETLLTGVFLELGLAPLAPEVCAAIRQGVEIDCDRLQCAVPGVLRALAAINMPKAVASNNTGARVRSALERTGMAPLFGGRVFTPDLVGHAKPHPGVYLAAAASFGVPPGQCLVLEDSVTGVTAAVAAGMTVLGFIGGGHVAAGQEARLKAAGALLVFNDMARLPALVATVMDTAAV